MEEAKREFVEPELVKYQEKLADVTSGTFNGYPDGTVDDTTQ
jgi:hypothetical protein